MNLLMILWLLLQASTTVRAAKDLGWEDDSDLTNFVTHPEIRAPLFSVAFYKPELVTPGYWFVGPYADIVQKPPAPKYYQPCQTGPAIYDGYGNLVWSGACKVDNQNACDFRAWHINGTDYLSTILFKYQKDPIGRGVIYDNSYKEIHQIKTPPEHAGMNMHELELIENGTAALHVVFRPEVVDISELQLKNRSGLGWIVNMGMREYDLRTGKTNFEWWAYPEVRLTESDVDVQDINGPYPHGWNWFHANSVKKNVHGDYLLSSRFTDTIYKIGKNGKLVWRLGGRKSDFELLGFNFSRQHDAQWIESECDEDERTEVVTFLDNGSDGTKHTSETSTAYKVKLDLKAMTAKVIQSWERPDERRSELRGNFQTLPSGNVFASWSDNSFVSEHTADGELVMAAEFMSNRFVTYRAYKFNFTGNPDEPPILKAFAYGATEKSSTTVVYMSWNGATEVRSWNLFALNSTTAQPLGSVWKTGFETRFQAPGYHPEVFAQAISEDGTMLGQTKSFILERPYEWDSDWQEIYDEDGLLDIQDYTGQAMLGFDSPGFKTEL